MAGNVIPKQARMMCQPSDNAIWLRAGSSASAAMIAFTANPVFRPSAPRSPIRSSAPYSRAPVRGLIGLSRSAVWFVRPRWPKGELKLSLRRQAHVFWVLIVATLDQMAFRFTAGEDPAAAISRMAREQTESALASLADPGHKGVQEAVFAARKRSKKVRAIVRLARIPLGEKRYRRANLACRDAARALAGHRDARSMMLALDGLVAASPVGLDEVYLGPLRSELAQRAGAALEAQNEAEPALRTAEDLLVEVADRIERWKLQGEGWELIGPGLAAIHTRGASAAARAAKCPDPERLHELRKEVKYTRYHLRMLRSTSPTLLPPMIAWYEQVGDQLGDARDLDLLADALAAEPDAFGGMASVEPVVAAAQVRRDALVAAALGLAGRLYAEPSTAFADRLEGYWDLWRTCGPEPLLAPAPQPDPVPCTEPASVVEPEPDDNAEPELASDGLDSLTVTRLRALAREHVIPGRSSLSRLELIQALRALGVAGHS